MNFITSLSDFLTYDFLWISIIGIIFLSVIMGVLSPIIVAKKYAFIGSAIAHSTLLGLAIASFIGVATNSFSFFLITTLITLLFALILAASSYQRKLPADTLIGIFFSATMSAGILIQTQIENSNANLFNYLFGNILLVENMDIILLAILAGIIGIHFFKNFNNWVSFCWNEEMASLNRVPTKIFHYLLFTTITLSIVLALKVAGIILVSSILITPGAFALRICSDIKKVFLISIVFTLVTGLISLVIANAFNLTVGPTIAVTQAVIFALTYIRKIR